MLSAKPVSIHSTGMGWMGTAWERGGTGLLRQWSAVTLYDYVINLQSSLEELYTDRFNTDGQCTFLAINIKSSKARTTPPTREQHHASHHHHNLNPAERSLSCIDVPSFSWPFIEGDRASERDSIIKGARPHLGISTSSNGSICISANGGVYGSMQITYFLRGCPEFAPDWR